MTKISFCCAAVIALAACGGDTTPSAPPTTQHDSGPTAASVAIDQSKGAYGATLFFDLRDQTALTATARDSSGAVLEGHPITWTSSAANVADGDERGADHGRRGRRRDYHGDERR